MNDHTFHDRTTWISFRADWRSRYKAISAEIRSVRQEIGENRRQRRALGTAGERYRIAADSLQSGLAQRSRRANAMMVELAEAKELKAEIVAARTEKSPLAA